MEKFTGKYEHDRNENFYQYFIAVGLPEELAQQADAGKPSVEIEVVGNKVTFKSEEPAPHTVTFPLDEEIEERVLINDIVLKSTAKFDGKALTVSSTTQDGKTGAKIFVLSDNDRN